MIAAYVKTKNKFELRNIPIASPRNNEVLIRVDACGICGSDYIEASHWAKSWKRFGHEVAGTVQSVGENVTKYAAGDRVVLALSVACGECAACAAGRPRYCTQLVVAEQGGFAELLMVPDDRLLHPIDSDIPAAVACLAEPLTVVLEAFDLAELSHDDQLLIVGGGFIGALSALVAHVKGVSVAGIMSRRLDANAERILQYVGGQHIPWRSVGKFSLPSSELQPALATHAGRTVVLHTAPAKTIPSYLKKLPYAATVVNIGLSGKSKDNKFELDSSACIFKRTQLLHAFPVPCLQLPEAVDVLERNVEIFQMIETQFAFLEDLPSHMIRANRSGKTIITAKA